MFLRKAQYSFGMNPTPDPEDAARCKAIKPARSFKPRERCRNRARANGYCRSHDPHACLTRVETQIARLEGELDELRRERDELQGTVGQLMP